MYVCVCACVCQCVCACVGKCSSGGLEDYLNVNGDNLTMECVHDDQHHHYDTMHQNIAQHKTLQAGHKINMSTNYKPVSALMCL